MFTLHAWAKAEKLPFRLMSDYGGSLCRSYGVWQDKDQFARRAAILIDAKGIVRYCNLDVTPDRLGRLVTDLTDALDSLGPPDG